jgi:peptidoglycan/xylan/chitin deacetylase (PgdA/CDA1 family)
MRKIFGTAAFYSVLIIGILIFIIFLTGYTEQANMGTITPAPVSTAGVAITFDDAYVDDWYEIRDLLKKYDANVTFFVTDFASLDENQVNKLKLLQDDGHEIAFHGSNHIDAMEYLKNHSISEYLNNQIIPGVDLMRNQGLNPVDFSYPFGSGSQNRALTQALHQYFLHIRGTKNSDAYHSLKDVNSAYYQYGENTSLIFGVGIDDVTYGNSLKDIYDGISRAKEEDRIVIFYSHDPVPSNPGHYQLSYDRLEKILINVSENKLKFYTISEIN